MAALWVITGRDQADFTRTRRLGAARFEQAVRREITRRGGHNPCLPIVRGLFTALADQAGVIAHRAGALVKHAGLAPREKLSGAFTGWTRLTGQGRPGLRLAAWRAVWGAQRASPVYGARYQHLTAQNRTS